MGFRFFKRVRITKGATLNFSRSGASLSFGTRGAKFTVGPRGRRATLGIPGTGIYYTTEVGKTGRSSRGRTTDVERAEKQLTLGFFERLVTPKKERALVDGCREMVAGDLEEALKHLRKAAHLPDGAYLAGFVAFKLGKLEDAAEYLEYALKKHRRLGKHLEKYGISTVVSLPITDEISAHVGPNLRGVLLELVEIYQQLGRYEDAIRALDRLSKLEPDDVVVKLSLVELLFTIHPNDEKTLRRIVKLTENVESETPFHTALLLYKAKALHRLGLLDGAREILTKALRRKKDRPQALLLALRYERALVYEALGRHRQARKEFERIYAEDPDYEDVTSRLGFAE